MKGIEWVLLLLLVLQVVLVFTQVVMRYFLPQSLTWSEEFARFGLVWLTFLGAVPALELGGHLAMETFQSRLSSRGTRVMAWVVGAFNLVFAGIMLYSGTLLVQSTWQQLSPAMEWRMGAVYAVLPVSGLLLAVSQVRLLLGLAPAYRKEPLPEAAARDPEPEPAA